MPSGAKKRKAAKKKKENQHPSNDHSDSTSAPAHTHGDEDLRSQDDRESNIGELSSPTSEKLSIEAEVEGASSMEGSRIDNGEERVGVEKELKIEGELGVKDDIIDHDEANRKPYDGGSSWTGSCGGTGSSSSDDESRGIKKQQAESSMASGVSVEMDNSLSGKSGEPVRDSVTTEADDSIVESVPAAIESDVLSQAAISVPPRVVASTFEENGKKKFGSAEERMCTSVEEADVGRAESTPKTLDPKECVAHENDDGSTSTCIAPRVASDNGAQRVKDCVVTQPGMFPSPYPAQKTSWKSCCGLFEVFSGSGD